MSREHEDLGKLRVAAVLTGEQAVDFLQKNDRNNFQYYRYRGYVAIINDLDDKQLAVLSCFLNKEMYPESSVVENRQLFERVLADIQDMSDLCVPNRGAKLITFLDDFYQKYQALSEDKQKLIWNFDYLAACYTSSSVSGHLVSLSLPRAVENVNYLSLEMLACARMTGIDLQRLLGIAKNVSVSTQLPLHFSNKHTGCIYALSKLGLPINDILNIVSKIFHAIDVIPDKANIEVTDIVALVEDPKDLGLLAGVQLQGGVSGQAALVVIRQKCQSSGGFFTGLFGGAKSNVEILVGRRAEYLMLRNQVDEALKIVASQSEKEVPSKRHFSVSAPSALSIAKNMQEINDDPALSGQREVLRKGFESIKTILEKYPEFVLTEAKVYLLSRMKDVYQAEERLSNEERILPPQDTLQKIIDSAVSIKALQDNLKPLSNSGNEVLKQALEDINTVIQAGIEPQENPAGGYGAAG